MNVDESFTRDNLENPLLARRIGSLAIAAASAYLDRPCLIR